ncbi:hypothetical protein R3P38DRAFT_597085 [Favolaschia claudopus]|uniref:Secreted protein n=1 Tax=Favolaschia claudopus TaxID=2862362 RepID=A0AAV9Z9C7_9AGAR
MDSWVAALAFTFTAVWAVERQDICTYPLQLRLHSTVSYQPRGSPWSRMRVQPFNIKFITLGKIYPEYSTSTKIQEQRVERCLHMRGTRFTDQMNYLFDRSTCI